MQPMFRTILLAGLGVSSVFVSAQDLNTKFSFSSGAMTAPRLLENLAKASGQRFSAGTQVKDDVLCVRFKDVTVQEAMDKIAKAASAEWQASDGGYLLTRSGATKLKLRRDEEAVRAKQLEEAIKKQLDEVEKTPKLTEEEAQRLAQQARQEIEAINRGIREGGGGQSGLFMTTRAIGGLQNSQPAARAIIRILAKMNSADLAALGPGTRTVFAMKPTPMQKALPGSAARIIESFLDEQRVMAEAAPAGTGFPGAAVAVPIGGGPPQPQIQSAQPGKVLMIVSRFMQADGLQVELKVADARTGQFYASGSAFIVPEFKTAKAGQWQGADDPIVFSKLSSELAKMLGGPSAGVQTVAAQFITLADGANTGDMVFLSSPNSSSKPIDLTPDWRDRVLHPEDFEPLSTAPSDIFMGLASAAGKNLVALIPDSALSAALARCAKGNLRPSEAVSLTDLELGCKIEESDGWVLISPKKPATALDERIDRRALGVMLRTLDKVGRLSLDDLAAYATTTEANYVLGGLDFSYLRLLDPVVADRQFRQAFQGNREMLQFYGYLGSSQRDALLAGRPMGFGTFSQKERELLHSMVFNSMSGPQIDVPGMGGPGRGPQGQMAAMLGRDSLQSERTEALPNGVPSNGFLVLRGNREQAVLATDAQGGNAQILTADALGRTRAMAANMRGNDAFGMPFELYRLGEQTSMTFQFNLQRNASLTRRLTDDKVDRKGDAVSYDQLPADFRRRVDQAATRMQRGMRGPGGGQGAAPPPVGDGR